MLSELEDDFMRLFEESQALKFSDDPREKDAIDRKIQNICRKLTDLQEKASRKLAHLEFCLNIAFESDKAVNVSFDSPRSQQKLTGICMEKLHEFAFFDLPSRMASFHLKSGDWYYAQSQWDAALASWEQVLKHDPNNVHIHCRLNQLMKNELESRDLSLGGIEG